MTVQEAINKVIKLAEAQVGYKASSDKHTKYTADLDALGDFYNFPKQWKGGGAEWCDIFFDWLLVKSFGAETGRKMLYQPKKSTGAGCGFSAGFYRSNNAWSTVPQLGSQIFYGQRGNESHTGIVIKVEDKFIWTVEGNVGGGTGQVQKKKVPRSANISGYGIPNWKLVTSTPKFKPQWGIDISVWQGNYNLAQAQKEGVKFVILKGGGGDDGLYKDSRYEQNYEKAKALKMPVGVYWFSRATTETQAKSEAEYFVQHCLKGKQFELPIYIDVEHRAMLNLGKRKLTDIILTWLKYVRNAGYWVGIYSSTSAFASTMYDNELKGYAHWVADWRGKCYYPNYYGMWQFGGDTNPIRSKKVAGQTTDQNYMYEDYETEIKAKGLNGWSKTPVPVPVPKLDVDGILGYNSVIWWQKWMKTYQDGSIDGQSKSQQKYYPALVNVKFGSGGDNCIKETQKLLNTKGNKLTIDGILGINTVKALQKFLNAQGNKLTVDGIMGTGTAKAFQTYLNKIIK